MDTTKNHIGQNIRRIRELRGLKQDALGFELGISQKQVSHLEHQESVAEETLLQIARVLGVSPHVITLFTEEAFINYCENFLNRPQDAFEVEPLHEASLHASRFAPHDKIFELYERLLQAEREKLAYVEKILEHKL
ncbi:helix-turn-helix transcriptional regulator [Aequorivita sp. F47161]|uniref:Helix-turn-helix transcriptional regulator n=1 Tax=Aequorivita vitellina TaxID=2874475 RepID=A0A9X1QS77_9FLAO|nr:helix-turn-helix transcriptional regulator [Aequorivita vitellina]MCG2417953.1 helix-turn-helix transcriptional regulator [Aequorivita vitellina]